MSWFDRIFAVLDDGNPPATPRRFRTFEVVLVLLCLTELWGRHFELEKLGVTHYLYLCVYVTMAGVAACTPASRGVGFALLAVGMGIAVWEAFPSTGNHVYLECFLCALCALLDPAHKDEQRLLVRSLRWITCVILFFAGIQKLVHGYYITGLMPAFLLQEGRFNPVFALLLPASEVQRIIGYHGYDGSGPYFVDRALWLLTANLVWILEIVLAIALFIPRTRQLAVFAAIAFVVAIETGAREFLFGLLFVNLLLMFLRNDSNRWLLPVASIVCVVLILVRLGMLPAMEIH